MAEGARPRPVGYGEALRTTHAASNRNPTFALGSLGGRWVLIGAIADPDSAAAHAAIDAAAQRAPRDETHRVCALFFGGAAPSDAVAARLQTTLVFNDAAAAEACGLLDPGRDPDGRWLLFDPSLRVLNTWPLAQTQQALAALDATPDPDLYAGASISAPVLIAPRVFEPAFCRVLIDYYAKNGGAPSGVTVQNQDGKALVTRNDDFKRRSDCMIEDAALRDAAMHRIYWRLAPAIEKAFMWRPTRLERYIVARYDANEGGFFRPHRDNTTPATKHRKFAVTINLNAGDYEGGDLRFPEFGARTYRAPTGGAVVFSCSLLHEATPVTRGERYAFLPFLYDDASAKVRAANNHLLEDSIAPYQEP